MKISKVLKIAFLNQGSKLPTSLILLITGRCNSGCGFCIFRDSINSNPDKLTLDDFQKISKSLKKIFRLHVSGGEPFLRDDLPQICKIFSVNNSVEEIAIPTNGLLPDRIQKKTEELIKECPNTNFMISISLDDLFDEHDKLRGVPGNFKKVQETYKKLISLKKIYPDLRVHVTTTLTKYNYDHIDELIKYIKKEMPELNSHNFELVRRNHSEYCEDLPSLEQCEKFEKKHKQIIRDTKNHFKSGFKSKLANIVKNYKFNLLIRILKEKRQIIPCEAGKSIGVINWRGDVSLCELLPKVGNIYEDSFENIWTSKQAEDQRKFIKEKKCFCTHGCFQGSSILFKPQVYPKIILYWLKELIK